MTRIIAALAALVLLSGCATYGDGYYSDRAVYADGSYYYPADEYEGDYYYGTEPAYDYNYSFGYGWGYGYTPFWGLDRYRCRSYYGCVPVWGGYYPYYYAPGWDFSLGGSWGWSHWGWYGGYRWSSRHRWYDSYYGHRYDGRRHDDRRDDRRPPPPRNARERLERENRMPARGRADDPDVMRRYEERRPGLGESGRREPDPIIEDERPRPQAPVEPIPASRQPASGLGRPAPRDIEGGRFGRPVQRDNEAGIEVPRRSGMPVRPAPASSGGPQMRYPVRQPESEPRAVPRQPAGNPGPRMMPREAMPQRPSSAPRESMQPRPMAAPRQAPAPRMESRPAPARPAPPSRPAPQVRPASQNPTSGSED